jgi:hypothetical protein
MLCPVHRIDESRSDNGVLVKEALYGASCGQLRFGVLGTNTHCGIRMVCRATILSVCPLLISLQIACVLDVVLPLDADTALLVADGLANATSRVLWCAVSSEWEIDLPHAVAGASPIAQSGTRKPPHEVAFIETLGCETTITSDNGGRDRIVPEVLGHVIGCRINAFVAWAIKCPQLATQIELTPNHDRTTIRDLDVRDVVVTRARCMVEDVAAAVGTHWQVTESSTSVSVLAKAHRWSTSDGRRADLIILEVNSMHCDSWAYQPPTRPCEASVPVHIDHAMVGDLDPGDVVISWARIRRQDSEWIISAGQVARVSRTILVLWEACGISVGIKCRTRRNISTAHLGWRNIVVAEITIVAATVGLTASSEWPTITVPVRVLVHISMAPHRHMNVRDVVIPWARGTRQPLEWIIAPRQVTRSTAAVNVLWEPHPQFLLIVESHNAINSGIVHGSILNNSLVGLSLQHGWFFTLRFVSASFITVRDRSERN